MGTLLYIHDDFEFANCVKSESKEKFFKRLSSVCQKMLFLMLIF